MDRQQQYPEVFHVRLAVDDICSGARLRCMVYMVQVRHPIYMCRKSHRQTTFVATAHQDGEPVCGAYRSFVWLVVCEFL